MNYEVVIRLISAAICSAIPTPSLEVSQWADNFRTLGSTSSKNGRWRSSFAPYQIEIMNSFSDPRVKRIVVKSSAQVGKTEIELNIIGYIIHIDPSPMLILLPTEDMAKIWSKDRLTPLLRDTPVLAPLVGEQKTRDGDNNTLHKTFLGGRLIMAGANSPVNLSSHPVRHLIGDEIDRMPLSAGTEGDPISLAKKRTITFPNAKHVFVSTPTNEGASRIDDLYEDSDQREFYVPCPDCGELQTLKWEQVKWDEGEESKAFYVCEHCAVVIEHHKKRWMLDNGRWIAGKPFNGTAGYHLNQLYSPFVDWGFTVLEYIEAKNKPETYKTWHNTALGLSYKEDDERLDMNNLKSRAEDYPADVPAGAKYLTAGVDVQANRLECEVVGWGEDEENWSINFYRVYGDPALPEVWEKLREILTHTFEHESGKRLRIGAVCIDSGGHHTEQVYKFCRGNAGRMWFAVKGSSSYGKPIISGPTQGKTQRINLFSIGTDTAKDWLYARLRITEHGPGFCHFPDWYEDGYYKQLTSEKVVKRKHSGKEIRSYEKITSGARNEALDCRVYAIAAYMLMQPDFRKLAKMFLPKPEVVKRDTIPPQHKPYKVGIQKGKGFVNGWQR